MNLLRSVLTFSFLVSSSLQAALILEPLEPLTEDQQTLAFDILRTYTGPFPKVLDDQTVSQSDRQAFIERLSNPKVPFADQSLAQEKMKEAKLPVLVHFVPTTVWNVFVTSSFLTEKTLHELYQKGFSKEGRIFQERFLFSQFKAFTGQIHFSSQTPDWQQVLKNFLMSIKDKCFDPSECRTAALLKELKFLEEKKPSLLQTLLLAEVAAAKNNKLCLIRATHGLQLEKKYLSLEEQINNLKRRIVETPEEDTDQITPQRGQELIKRLEASYQDPEYQKKLERLTSLLPHRFLDYPIDTGKKNLGEALWSFNFIKDFVETIELSYAFSVLDGFLFDSFNKTTSACTYEFLVKHPEINVYSLAFEKSYLWGPVGKELMYLPKGALDTEGILGFGEVFHPRLRKGVYSRNLKVIPGQEYSYRHIYLTILSQTFNQEAHYTQTIQTSDPHQKNLFLFMLEVSHLLTQAKILSVKGQVEDPQTPSKEALDLLKAQRDAHNTVLTLLQEQLSFSASSKEEIK
jgi:hypothetical protein